MSRRPYELGKSNVIKDGEDVALLTFGKMTKTGLAVANLLEEKGVDARVVDMRFAKPIDEGAVKSAKTCRVIATIEDGILQGGAGEAVAAILARGGSKKRPKLLNFAVDNAFVSHGPVDELFTTLGLDPKYITQQITKSL